MGVTVKKGVEPRSENPERETGVELILTDELARADRALSSVPPVLTHMLASSGQTLVSDAIVARLRGMLSSMASQLLSARNETARPLEDSRTVDQLSDRLAGDNVVLSYCYALAMEGILTERLAHRASIDPILSPLLQELIASDRPAVAEMAMNALAAQSRFIQSQRRMELPLSELPAELLDTVLKRWMKHDKTDPTAAEAVKRIKASYDEGAGRIGLFARLVASMKSGVVAALELEHAGLALFASALSKITHESRELTVLGCHEQQAARLALSLRAGGLSPASIERQFMLLEPVDRLPSDIASIDPARAALVLKQARSKRAF
ncbi:hypothetical protein [Erythrobacter crassostreae]|uniref:Uncharacterized protein n=1 Tax=Erythrobacter crassostreae TaxID=2828328 RepID=A0A9X1JLN7_9SPHN|nr:hypothetical protein [Erythrobacter crassostrea]MBV7260231.1 hypothetical protein [Erythrobacter crassostrea]